MSKPRAPMEPDRHDGDGSPGPLWGDTKFAGSDYVQKHDLSRLTGQIRAIYDWIEDGEWRTLREIADGTGFGEASISAQLRNLRKEPHSMTIEKRPRGERSAGLWEYRLGGGA